jgi:glycosyltransferase involved in cell wall biosynthesis
LKILHVITTLDVGGAEMHLLSQVRGQASRGHGVRVAYLKGEGTLADDFRAAGAEEIVHVPLGPGVSRILPHLRWAEIVHSHLLKADVFCAVLAPLAGRRDRLVSGKHNDEQVIRKPLVSFVHGIIARLPRRTIVLSEHVGRFFHRYGKVPAQGMRRVWYGIDPSPFAEAASAPAEVRRATREELGIGGDDIVFICVARFAPQKAHDVLLRAFHRALLDAPPDAPPIRLLLVGGDPFGDGRERTEALAGELELGDRCVFAGIRRDVPELLAASDVFVMSSLWEGLGLVFLEAMAASIPVLATGVSAVPEVVVDGVTGTLVPPADVEAMGAAMRELAADPELRRKLGAGGAERVVSAFGLDRMVEETLAIYRELVEGSAPDPAVLFDPLSEPSP